MRLEEMRDLNTFLAEVLSDLVEKTKLYLEVENFWRKEMNLFI